MAEYIEREAVLEFVEPDARPFLAERIKSIPAADVRENKRGKWIPDYDYTEYDYDGSTLLPEPRKFQDGWQCSLCGEYTPSETNFCSNCGAEMREET